MYGVISVTASYGVYTPDSWGDRRCLYGNLVSGVKRGSLMGLYTGTIRVQLTTFIVTIFGDELACSVCVVRDGDIMGKLSSLHSGTMGVPSGSTLGG